MALTEFPAPEELKKSFLKLLDAADGGAGASPGPPVIISLPVYILSVRSLADGKVAPRAKQAGWQFLTVGPDGLTISGDVPSQSSASEPPAASRSRGPVLQKALAAYNAVKDFDQVKFSPYEPRALRIPGLHIEAFWLRKKPENPNVEQLDSDFVVSFQTFNAELSSEPILTMRQFLDKARPLAVKRLASSSPQD